MGVTFARVVEHEHAALTRLDGPIAIAPDLIERARRVLRGQKAHRECVRAQEDHPALADLGPASTTKRRVVSTSLTGLSEPSSASTASKVSSVCSSGSSLKRAIRRSACA